ncbi:MAG: class I SAM-dependent methyltransferase [Anaerolineae bacterium]|nr:class I SAM-dependent methyltransferase [Gloeobacterales cyanobacterium ES-bin-313]
MDITASVQNLYERYPFPPDPITKTLPPGWNWRWSWSFAHSFCFGTRPSHEKIRILDAGCGTGVSTEYLAFQNPEAMVLAIDISKTSLDLARQRCAKFNNVQFAQMDLAEASQLEGSFDLINSVGVLHHLADPKAGIQTLAGLLAPGGLMHIFVYGALGRWEIELMQQAIRLLRDPEDPLGDGLKVGRELFRSLPEDNRLVQADRRWQLENNSDICFVDMYVHVQEIRYTIPSLFDLIDASALDFLGFSNPQFWSLERLLEKAPWLIERAQKLSERDRYRLIELLDPIAAHYEFFLGKPPLITKQWTPENFQEAVPLRSSYINPWPDPLVFDHEYELVRLNPAQIAFLDASDGKSTVGEILKNIPDLSFLDIETLRAHFLLQY